MSLKINISYTEEKELLHALRLLQPLKGRIKVPKTPPNGHFKHAYITCTNTENLDKQGV